MFWHQAFLLSQMKLTAFTVVPSKMMFGMSGILESITVVCLSCTGVIAVVLSYLYISLHTTGVRHTKKTERKT